MSDTPREPGGRTYRIAVLLGAVASAATWIWLALTAPQRVPTHWSGEVPDGWSSKPAALAVCGLLLPGVALGIVQLSRLVTAWPAGINVPHKDWWLAEPRRLVRFERLLREDMMLIAAAVLGLSALMNVTIGVAAQRPDGAVPTAVFGVSMALVIGSVLAVVARMLRGRYDPVDGL